MSARAEFSGPSSAATYAPTASPSVAFCKPSSSSFESECKWWFLEIINIDRLYWLLQMPCSLVIAGTIDFWKGLYKIEIVDKNIKQIWSHLNETEFCVDFKSVSISQ